MLSKHTEQATKDAFGETNALVIEVVREGERQEMQRQQKEELRGMDEQTAEIEEREKEKGA